MRNIPGFKQSKDGPAEGTLPMSRTCSLTGLIIALPALSNLAPTLPLLPVSDRLSALPITSSSYLLPLPTTQNHLPTTAAPVLLHIPGEAGGASQHVHTVCVSPTSHCFVLPCTAPLYLELATCSFLEFILLRVRFLFI